MFSWRRPSPEAERLETETTSLQARVRRSVREAHSEIRRSRVLDSYAAADDAVGSFRKRGVL
jgi:hypothetical protein